MSDSHGPAGVSYHAITDALGTVVIVLGCDGRIIEWNLEAERVYGVARAEAIGQDYVESFLPASVREPVRADMRKVLSGEPTRDFDNPVIARDGVTRLIRWSVRRLLDDAGRPAAIVANGYDVTEQKRYFEQVDRREIEVRAILDNAPIVVFMKDLAGRFTFVNEKFNQIFGFEREFVIGKMDGDFLPASVAQSNRDNDRAAIDAGAPVEVEEVIPGKDGERVYWASKFALRDAEGAIYAICGVASDITPLRRAEAERALLQARIIDSQQAALRELSTPLLPIADSVVLLPLVGTMDSVRAQQMLEVLLEGVTTHRARVAILDITGVRTVDADVAGGLVRAAQAARLLGAEVVLTGMRPAAAQALVELGVDLRGVATLASLEHGVAYAMGR